MRLEAEMWAALDEMALREGTTTHVVCSEIDAVRSRQVSLTAAVRVSIVKYFRAAATGDGHRRAGHGDLPTPH